jgi:serine/threonine-protein kinase
LFGVLAVYGGASWVILQVVDILQSSLQLPPWVGAVALLLLAIGLFVVLATALVQSNPLTDQREAADEVPGSWEVDLGDLKDSVSRGRVPHLTWGRALLGGAIVFSLLFGFLGLWVVIQDRGESFAPAEAVANDAAAPAIAVLPFSVSGEGLDGWREGTVNLLSTNLDGAAGLRAIDSRTVLAQWDRQVGDDTEGDRETALQIAGATGARWALLGTAVAIGPRVRLTADVVDLETGVAMGQARAEGPPDSVLALVDGLTVDVLRTLLGEAEGDLEPVSLAAVTTASIPALRAFLEGEAANRKSEFEVAVEAYERAVAADSSFALAWDRLASAIGWDDVTDERMLEARSRAWELRERLPERRVRMVEVSYGQTRDDPSTIENARALVTRYPDDPEAWYLLGETYRHLPPTYLSTLEEQVRTFERAIDLDPSFAPYRIHHLELAFMMGDSAAAHERLREYARLASEDMRTARETVRMGLAFGDSATHARTLAGLDTVPSDVLQQVVWAEIDLRHLQVPEEAAAALEARGHEFEWGDQIWRTVIFWARGQFARVWPLIPEVPFPQLVAAFIADPAATGLAVPPPDLVDLVLEAESETERTPILEIWDAADGYRAIIALSSGRPAEYEARLEALSRAREQALADGDSTFARRAEAVDLLARASRALRKEGIDAALPLVRRANAIEPIPHEMGEFLMQAGLAREAIPYLRYSWDNAWAWYRLGQAYEQEGEHASARDAYEVFVAAWAEADPELQPFVEDARRRLVALIEALD